MKGALNGRLRFEAICRRFLQGGWVYFVVCFFFFFFSFLSETLRKLGPRFFSPHFWFSPPTTTTTRESDREFFFFFLGTGTGDTTDGHRRVSLRGAPSFTRLGQPCRAGGGREWRG